MSATASPIPMRTEMGIDGVAYNEAAERRQLGQPDELPRRSVRMTAYVALIRAVNVSGTGKLPKEDLKAWARPAASITVRTFINSGNLLFTSELGEAEVKKRIGAAGRRLFRQACAGLCAQRGARWPRRWQRNPFTDDKPSRRDGPFHRREAGEGDARRGARRAGRAHGAGPAAASMSPMARASARRSSSCRRSSRGRRGT